jgi:hypothetical protein
LQSICSETTLGSRPIQWCIHGGVGQFHGGEAPVGDRVLPGRQGGRRRERRKEQRDRHEQPLEHDGFLLQLD